jgi:hypothetical protein
MVDRYFLTHVETRGLHLMMLVISSEKIWKSWISSGIPGESSRVANWARRSTEKRFRCRKEGLMAQFVLSASDTLEQRMAVTSRRLPAKVWGVRVCLPPQHYLLAMKIISAVLVEIPALL